MRFKLLQTVQPAGNHVDRKEQCVQPLTSALLGRADTNVDVAVIE